MRAGRDHRGDGAWHHPDALALDQHTHAAVRQGRSGHLPPAVVHHADGRADEMRERLEIVVVTLRLGTELLWAGGKRDIAEQRRSVSARRS